MRTSILEGRLKAGTRLPSTRAFAEQYAMARGTVVDAFEQLAAEGYIRSGVGVGTFVHDELPEKRLPIPFTATQSGALSKAIPFRLLSRRGLEFAGLSPFIGSHTQPAPLFNPHQPALKEFPLALWKKTMTRRSSAIDDSLLGDGDPQGLLQLRENISQYLGMTRGIKADPSQILVLSSMQQGLELSARLLLDDGEAVLFEDPGYPGARAVLRHARTHIVPVPVDHAGMQVNIGIGKCKSARLVYITPSRQAPLGMALALSRRVELLDWAARTGAWIFEDDYDGEFRYRGKPVAALQAIDQHGRVIYAGSFSKTLFPALRISYLVLPRSLVDAFVAARSLITRFPPLLEQAALSDFIQEGHYARHLRRMNLLYADRRAALVAAVSAAPSIFEGVTGDEAGLSLIAWLRPDLTEQHALRAARACGLFVQPLSAYVIEQPQRPALVLGFAGGSPAQHHFAIKSFAAAIKIA